MMKTKYMSITAAVLLSLFAATTVCAQFHGHPKDGADYPKLNYDSLYQSATPLAQSPRGKQLLDKCLEAFGGVEHLEGLHGYRTAWEITTSVYRDPEALLKSVATNRRHRVHMERSDHFQTRIMNGTKAWFVNPDTVIFVDGMRYNAELFSDLSLRLPLCITTERFDGVRYGERAGDSLAYLYMDKNDSLLFIVGVDPADGLIKVIEGEVKHGEQHMVFVNLLSDYESVEGYLFPRKLTNISMGLKVGESTVKKIEVNPEFPPDEFTKPEMPKE